MIFLIIILSDKMNGEIKKRLMRFFEKMMRVFAVTLVAPYQKIEFNQANMLAELIIERIFCFTVIDKTEKRYESALNVNNFRRKP